MGRLAGYANLTPNHVEMTDANFNAKYAGEQPGDWADISFDASSSASAGAELHRASCGSVRALSLARARSRSRDKILYLILSRAAFGDG